MDQAFPNFFRPRQIQKISIALMIWKSSEISNSVCKNRLKTTLTHFSKDTVQQKYYLAQTRLTLSYKRKNLRQPLPTIGQRFVKCPTLSITKRLWRGTASSPNLTTSMTMLGKWKEQPSMEVRYASARPAEKTLPTLTALVPLSEDRLTFKVFMIAL